VTTIRPARLDDAPALASLMTALGYPTEVTAMRVRLEHLFADAEQATFVADGTGGIVGVTGGRLERGFELDGQYCRLLALVVAEGARNRGLGARLLDALERWAADRGARQIVLTSATHRTRAHRFYERHGYVHTGVRLAKPLTDAGLVRVMPDAPTENR
jgi:ribosomal protein S18 acetylase RimI-like enzyme